MVLGVEQLQARSRRNRAGSCVRLGLLLRRGGAGTGAAQQAEGGCARSRVGVGGEQRYYETTSPRPWGFG